MTASNREGAGGATASELRRQFRRAIAGYASKTLKRENGTRRGEDIEELHQMRTHANRLRGLLRLAGEAFGAKGRRRLEKDLEWLSDTLGRGRDLDVALERLDELVARVRAERDAPGLEAARAFLDTRRQNHYDGLRAALDSARWARLKARLGELARDSDAVWRKPPRREADGDGGRLAAAALSVTIQAIEQRRRVALTTMDDLSLHRFRIACKRGRYLCETLAPMMGRDFQRGANLFKAIQDCLGEMRDLDLLRVELRVCRFSLLGDANPDAVRRDLPGLRRLDSLCHARKESLWKQFEKLWRRYLAPRGPVARLAALAGADFPQSTRP